MEQENPTIQRLEDQIRWYSSNGTSNQRWFRGLKILEIVLAAFIPFLAGINAVPILTGMAGILIVVLEGFQHIFQFQKNWLNYRSTAENLKHEKYLWLAKSGPYLDTQNPDVILAERIEGLISQEHAKWITTSEKTTRVGE